MQTDDDSQKKIALLISIDDYMPPKSLSMTATVGVTAILYNFASNKILWQNSIRQESGNESLLFGLGGYVGGLFAKSIQSAEKPYQKAVYATIGSLLDTMPSCPESLLH